MNILVVHETEYVDKFIYEYQIIPEILSSWSHKVFVIDYPTFWKKKSFFDLGSFKTVIIPNVRRAGKERGVTLIRPGFIKIPVISRISAFFTHLFSIQSSIRLYNIEKIILYGVPTNGLQTLFWASVFRIPVLFRALDISHQLVPSKLLSLPTYLIEKIVYSFSSKILAITPRLTRYVTKIGNNKDAIYIPSGADKDIFKPEEKSVLLLNKYSLTKYDFILLFAGSLYSFSGLDVIIGYIPYILSHIPNFKLIIIGRGEQEKELKDIVKKMNLSRYVIFTGFINYEKLNTYINLASVCINPFLINRITNDIFPGKIYQYAACKKITLTTELRGVKELFPETKSSGILYFDLYSKKEFLSKLIESQSIEFEDKHPSLNQITKMIENELINLKFAKV